LPKEFFDRSSLPKHESDESYDSTTAVDLPLSDVALALLEVSAASQEEGGVHEGETLCNSPDDYTQPVFAAPRMIDATKLPMFDMVYRSGTFPVGMVPETFSAEAIKPERIALLMQMNASLAEADH